MTKTGLLLIALGTPKSAATDDVRDYLRDFLSDPLVIQMPRAIWLPILHTMILPHRPERSAAMYRQIWTDEGSPLALYTARQAAQLQQLLPATDVRYAMTYGAPAIADTLSAMSRDGVTTLQVLPLYPQYSLTTVEPIIRQVKAADPTARIIPPFYDHPSYVALLTDSIRQLWAAKPYDKLIFSYHGIPLSYVKKKGDPYEAQSKAITAAVVASLGLDTSQYEHLYQSKFGPAKWLGPATIARMAQLPAEGSKKILVVSPSFVADCLETLYELDIENKKVFLDAGGTSFDFVHPFNDSLAFTEFLKTLTKL